MQQERIKRKLKVSRVDIQIKRSGLRVFNSKVFSLASLLNISEFLWYVNPGIKHWSPYYTNLRITFIPPRYQAFKINSIHTKAPIFEAQRS